MMDFNERVIPGVSSNFMFKEALARYEFASKFVKAGDRILDLGCGTGYGARVLSKKGTKVLGVDIDELAINFANKKYSDKKTKFTCADVTNLKKIKSKYDVIVSFEVIEHLKSPTAFLVNVYKRLKTGGVFILSTPNAKIISPAGGVSSPYHEKEYDYDELDELLKKKFENAQIYGQTKSKNARTAWIDFLRSQKNRQNLADSDKLGIRKLIPKSLKEKIWKYVGNFFGRGKQEDLTTADFAISKKSVRLSFYFVAVCQKSQ